VVDPMMARSKKKRSVQKAVPHRVTELETAIADMRESRKPSPRTARLIASGLPRMAQKVAEEATEVVIEAVRGRRAAVVKESVDLLYNLAVRWSELGIAAAEVRAEMDRRQALLGMRKSCQRTPRKARRPSPASSVRRRRSR
jgi:phosphoribosyl-ATP pyrophosphohydrolase